MFSGHERLSELGVYDARARVYDPIVPRFWQLDPLAEAPLELGPNDGRVNYGGSVGMGVALKAGPGSLHIEARGTYLTSSEADGNLLNGKLSVGYLIPIGR